MTGLKAGAAELAAAINFKATKFAGSLDEYASADALTASAALTVASVTPEPDPNKGGGSGGCSAGPSAGYGLIALLALLALTVKVKK